MTRRIREAIIGVSTALLLVLGLPLAVAVHRVLLNNQVVRVQAAATHTLAEIAVPLDRAQLAAIRAEADAPSPFSVYDATGARVSGGGPLRANALIRRALRGVLARTDKGRIEVAVPITDRSVDERVVGAVQVIERLDGVDHDTRIAWAVMAVSAALALGVAWVVSGRLAARLANPLIELAANAEHIGSGRPVRAPGASGISEIDTLAKALGETTTRVNDALARERQFAGDVSHQLRTPLAGVRLRLEQAIGDHDAIAPALKDLARLEDTVTHLLAVARDAVSSGGPLALAPLVAASIARWKPHADSAGRAVHSSVDSSVRAIGAEASVTQVIDALIDNALVHGSGAVTVAVRAVSGGAAIDVQDEGHSLSLIDAERIFRRGEGTGSGIGLSLARSMAEREGGRLVLSQTRPTTFSIILVGPADDTSNG